MHVVAGNVALLSLRARLSPVKLNASAVRLCVLKDPTANVVSPPSYKAAVRVCISVLLVVISVACAEIVVLKVALSRGIRTLPKSIFCVPLGVSMIKKSPALTSSTSLKFDMDVLLAILLCDFV